MGRAPCCEKVGIKKGRWTAEEDKILSDYIQSNGEGSWRSLPKNAGLKRCGKSCRLRWINYLRSDLKRGNITPEEEDLIVKLHSTMGNRWSIIASNLPGRTDNEIKNYWNSHLSRKLHSYYRKSTFENAPALPPKRRPGRTSRSAMKPKLILNPKTHKNPRKGTKNDVALPVTTKENGEGNQEEALMVLSISNLGGPCDNGDEHGSCKPSINGSGDDGVLCFNDDIFDACFLMDEPHAVHVSSSESNNVEDSEVKRGSESNNNVVGNDTNHTMVTDDFVDWDFVWREGQNLWDDKEGLDSMSWEEIESELRQTESSNGFKPLDLDDENAMVGWFFS